MITKWRICLVLAIVVAAIVVFFRYRRVSDWSFVSRVTGFEFAYQTEYLAQYDNREWYVVSVVRLPEGCISAFAQKHHFTRADRREISSSLSLPKAYQQIPVRSDMLCASGQTKFQSWTAILDPRSRLLWIEVTYPDWSGQHEGTAPQPPESKS